ncbi:MAG: flagellar basal body rod C-terminal domain-containing protein [Phycisphaerae bacterium]
MPINIADPSIGSIKIGRNGEVNQGDEVLGRIGVVDFEDRTALKKAGQSTFKLVGDTPTISATADIHGGNVEASTVDSIAALTSMIEVSRAYDLNARMISLQDETLGMATTRIGRVG